MVCMQEENSRVTTAVNTVSQSADVRFNAHFVAGKLFDSDCLRTEKT